MATNFTLPDGDIAVIRDPKEVTEAQRRPVTRLQMRLAVSPVGQLLARKAEVGPEPKEGDAPRSAEDMAALEAIDAEFADLMADNVEALDLIDDLNDALIMALVESVNGAPLAAAIDLKGKVYDALKTETAKHVVDLMPTFSANPDPASPTPPSAT